MTNEEHLEALLDRWEELQSQGKESSVEELCRDCPELLEPLRERMNSLRLVDRLLQGSPSGENRSDEQTELEAPGRYRLLHLHARGGQGEVLLAADESLQREVALKRLQIPRAADPDTRDRFVAEARITGQLEHPGVVPVYGLGWDEDGHPYYAMRFIHGQTLDAAIRLFHSPTGKAVPQGERNLRLRNLLRGFLTACQTVAYALSRGIIHRDLKPSNIMLGDFGETLVVDWGLAKELAKQTPAPESATEPSSVSPTADRLRTIGVKGSPAYMSPEQAAGRWDQVGSASDVYSLGATLYAILTGEPPFDGSDLAALLDRVKRGEFPPPRKRDRTVPRSLEAICLKAMHLNPRERYDSAWDLADDVERWLADEPVRAWPEPLLMRARRWVKAHRTVVTSLIAVLVVAAGILAVTGHQLRQKNDRLANRMRLNLRLVRQLALQSADPERFLKQPLSLTSLEEVQANLDDLSEDEPDSDELRFALAYVHLNRGLKDESRGLPGNVERHFHQAQELFQRLQDKSPNDPVLWLNLAVLQRGRGERLLFDARVEEARKELLEARDRFLTLVDEKQARERSLIRRGKEWHGLDDIGLEELARVTTTLAEVSSRTQEPPAAKVVEWLNIVAINLEYRLPAWEIDKDGKKKRISKGAIWPRYLPTGALDFNELGNEPPEEVDQVFRPARSELCRSYLKAREAQLNLDKTPIDPKHTDLSVIHQTLRQLGGWPDVFKDVSVREAKKPLSRFCMADLEARERWVKRQTQPKELEEARDLLVEILPELEKWPEVLEEPELHQAYKRFKELLQSVKEKLPGPIN